MKRRPNPTAVMITIPKLRIAILLLLAGILSGCVARPDYKYPYFGGGASSGVPPRGSGVSRGL